MGKGNGQSHGQNIGNGNSHVYGSLFTQQWMLKDAKQIIQSTLWDFLE